MRVYYPDTLEFDVSGIVGAIGKGIVSVGTKLFTEQNISTVVSGIVAKQVAKSQQPRVSQTATVPMPSPTPGGMYSMPPVSTQPVIISGGGGGGYMPGVAPAPASVPGDFLAGINPIYIMGGALIAALLITRR